METFKAIAKIKYQENFFYVLINKSMQKYFIKELEDGSIMYPTVEEYAELYKTFSKRTQLAAIRLWKDYEIDPKIIAKGGKLLALGAVIAALGITIPNVIRDFQEPVPIVETIDNENEYTLEESYRRIGYDFHPLTGYEGQRMYRIHEYVLSTREERVIECQNFEEFASFVETGNNPSYDDVRQTIAGNPNISEKYKQWLLEGLGNLEAKLPNLNLTVLNYNLNRLQLEQTTSEVVNEGGDNTLVGRFDSETGKAYFVDMGDDQSNKFVLFHEVFGHGMSEATFERPADETFQVGKYTDWTIHIAKERIVVSDSIFVMQCFDEENEYGRDYDFFYLGQGLEEGKADQIAKLAMGNMQIIGSPYVEQTETLRIMCEAVGLSFEDYIANGGSEILNQRMQENDVQDSLVYINSSDIYVNAMKADSIELLDEKNTFKANILAFFKDYADNKIKAGESRSEIVAKFSKILSDGGEYIHSTFTSEEINFEDLANDVAEAAASIPEESPGGSHQEWCGQRAAQPARDHCG